MNSLSQILNSIATGKYVGLVGTRGQVWAGRVTGIAMEDGSGKNWNVTILNSKGVMTVFVKAE